MGLSTSHILLLILVAFLIFGAGKLPQLMSDFAKGLKAFKKGLHEEEPAPKKAVASKKLSKPTSKKPKKKS
ncbi:MAG: Sec-independent protein translocase subunit TatA [Candidatus Paracaedimonas acanthamoebae]|uniref:Sec-independent protein translocase protein TatA n=1 Tax=Candidatus Paracaedimonas acanthamoebae TaxID=244581 RepID=A0A8J7TTH6_9PROT|nr:Sec-independent protein translocase subunit TatA [Candidatus Paracaedimonas acanthamoebae]